MITLVSSPKYPLPTNLYTTVTYPHREADPGIAMASLFLRLMSLKVLPYQLKFFVNLTFSPKVWPFCLFWFTLSWDFRKSSKIEVTLIFCHGYIFFVIFEKPDRKLIRLIKCLASPTEKTPLIITLLYDSIVCWGLGELFFDWHQTSKPFNSKFAL